MIKGLSSEPSIALCRGLVGFAIIRHAKCDESTTAWDESTTAEFFWDESGAPAEQA